MTTHFNTNRIVIIAMSFFWLAGIFPFTPMKTVINSMILANDAQNNFENVNFIRLYYCVFDVKYEHMG